MQHIELVRHWPRESVVGASGVIGKSWSRERFDSSITGSTDGSSAAADDAESTAGGCVASLGKRDLEESGEEKRLQSCQTLHACPEPVLARKS